MKIEGSNPSRVAKRFGSFPSLLTRPLVVSLLNEGGHGAGKEPVEPWALERLSADALARRVDLSRPGSTRRPLDPPPDVEDASAGLK